MLFSLDYEYGFYSIIPDRFIYKGSATNQSDIYFLDTGSTLTYLPAVLAKEFNGLFNPPATKIENSYYVDCNATAPAFAIQIGGVVFSVIAPSPGTTTLCHRTDKL
jgi:hypothetical protein